MRFFDEGPSLPDELLVARDEGRLILFCGAGVSMAQARFPDFFQLAERVMNDLGSASDSPARKLIEVSKNLQRIRGVSGVVSADRVFSQLEQEFRTELVEPAVARALKPAPGGVDLSAHRLALDLAAGPDGKVRLVTTNFDLLFEACDPTLPRHSPPRLPTPSRYNDLVGITHLHGYLDDDYSRSAGDGLVLSSGQFGLAYLSEAWATRFFREILDNYQVLFLGYAADDPPVTYLLEALGRTAQRGSRIYAFHPGSEETGRAIWGQRGVRAIAYDDAANHRSLWQTISAWAERARNPSAWQDKVIKRSLEGPEALAKCERGQVAHLISTSEGAAKFAFADVPPPATWLCTFDPLVRYAKPGRSLVLGKEGPTIDPFAVYALDSDQPSTNRDEGELSNKANVPPGSWSAFDDNPYGLDPNSNPSTSTLRGYGATRPGPLGTRMRAIAHWIARVANQPAAVWWAAGQTGLHPALIGQITLKSREPVVSPEIQRAWRRVEMSNQTRPVDWHERLALESSLRTFGWDAIATRSFAQHLAPRLKVERPFLGGPTPPCGDILSLRQLLSANVDYPNTPTNLQIPDNALIPLVRALRGNLELAVELETEIDGYALKTLPPFEPDNSLVGAQRPYKHGLDGAVFLYLDLLERLAAMEPSRCHDEFQAWPRHDTMVFARLRIWMSGQERVTSAETAGNIFATLANRAFWHVSHQRDLLLALKKRWPSFSEATRERIEVRLRRGPRRWRNEETEMYRERRMVSSAERLQWLAENGCHLSERSSKQLCDQLRANPRISVWAAKAATSVESVGGWVTRDTSYKSLLGIPLAAVISTAAEISKTRVAPLTQAAPFEGLSAKQPARALGALVALARLRKFPTWAWQAFLDSEPQRSCRAAFVVVIASRLSQLPDKALTAISYSAASWFSIVGASLIDRKPEIYEHLWTRIVAALRANKKARKSTVVRTKNGRDWATEALNSPGGKLAQAILALEERYVKLSGHADNWFEHMRDILCLPGDARRHALTIFANNLPRLFAKNQLWTTQNLLTASKSQPLDREAFWSGYLWGARGPSDTLFGLMKEDLLALVLNKHNTPLTYLNVLSGILLSRWVMIHTRSNAPHLTNEQMRAALLEGGDEFRRETLWNLSHWVNEEAPEEVDWTHIVSEFLAKVWPRQRTASTPASSTALCNFLLESGDLFPNIVSTVLPLLSRASVDGLSFLGIGLAEKRDPIPKQHPERALALMHAVLPNRADEWPFGIEETLKTITDSDPTLVRDERMIELRRKLNSR